MPKLKATVAYDGTAYRGFQLQLGEDTIQGRLEAALSQMAKEPVRVTAAGRTDSGVHAWAQVVHFLLPKPIPPRGILDGLNSMLPDDIRVRECEEADDSFHARFDARSKTYHYYFDRSPVPSPFRVRFTLHYPYALDREALDEGAAIFLGERDFAGFRASSCAARTTIRSCTVSRFLDEGEELVYENRVERLSPPHGAEPRRHPSRGRAGETTRRIHRVRLRLAPAGRGRPDRSREGASLDEGHLLRCRARLFAPYAYGAPARTT